MFFSSSMPRLTVLPQYSRVVDSPSPRSPSNSPTACVTSSRSTSPLSLKSSFPLLKQSAFSLVCPKGLRAPEEYLSAREMSVLMYGNTLSSLMPTNYSPYIWNHLPGLLLPCPRFGKTISPERIGNADSTYIPEVKVGK